MKTSNRCSLKKRKTERERERERKTERKKPPPGLPSVIHSILEDAHMYKPSLDCLDNLERRSSEGWTFLLSTYRSETGLMLSCTVHVELT